MYDLGDIEKEFGLTADELEKEALAGLENMIMGIDISQVINDKVLICPVGYGAINSFEERELDKFFTDCKVDFTLKEIYHTDHEVDNEYRLMDSDPAEIKTPGIKNLLLFEKNIKTAKSLIGSLVWAIEHQKILGIDKIYLGAVVDAAGIANFSCSKTYKEFLGAEKYIEKNMPKTYDKLKENNGFSLLSNHIPRDIRMLEEVSDFCGVISSAVKDRITPERMLELKAMRDMASTFVRREGIKILNLVKDKVFIYTMDHRDDETFISSYYLNTFLKFFGVEAFHSHFSVVDDADEVFPAHLNIASKVIFIDKYYNEKTHQMIKDLVKRYKDKIKFAMYVNTRLVDTRLHYLEINLRKD